MREQSRRSAYARPPPAVRLRAIVGDLPRSRWSRPPNLPEKRESEQVPSLIRSEETEETQSPAQAQGRLQFPVLALLVALQIPWIIQIGELRLAPYRFVLLAMLPICFVQWASGKAGKIRLTDIALLLFCSWCGLAIVVVHGIGEAVQPTGIIFIETMGGYLLARCYIRSQEDFYQLAKLLFVIAMFLFPFALYEMLTGQNLILKYSGMVMPSYMDVAMPRRWGLDRAQGNNIHPIHFGVVIASTLTMTHLVLGYGRKPVARYARSFLVFFTAAISLSSGPITSMVGQIAFLIWNRLMHGFKHKWSLVVAGGVALVIFVELTANRSLPAILIGYFAFDEDSAYIRTLTWHFGTQSIMNHPLWGTGFGPWDKPSWLTPSIDMHWIIDSIRYGLPAGFLIFLAFFSAVFAVGLSRNLDEKLSTYRTAYVITMAGFFMTGWAVYLWETSYALFTFMLGSGFWLIEAGERRTAQGDLSSRRPTDEGDGGRRRPGGERGTVARPEGKLN